MVYFNGYEFEGATKHPLRRCFVALYVKGALFVSGQSIPKDARNFTSAYRKLCVPL